MVEFRYDQVHAGLFAVAPAFVLVISISCVPIKVYDTDIGFRGRGENTLNDAVVEKNRYVICHRRPPRSHES